MKSLHDVPAPAKLNLFLHITGRRPDGYHLLQSVFMLIDWCDTLHFEKRSDGVISREDLTMALPEQDLITRAAHLLKTHTGCTDGVHIAVDKQIPAQAGMGGGSSDAATCMLALNRLWNLNLDLSSLEKLGLQLGADVPFFLRGRNAWVEGIGEQITPLTLPDEVLQTPLMLLKPAIAVPTAAIFGSDALKRDTKPATVADFLAAPKRFGQNDLQDAAVAYQASSESGNDIGLALEVMQNQFGNSRMTGSGSAVFAQAGAADAPPIAEVESMSIPEGWVARTCRGLGRHPLVDWAD